MASWNFKNDHQLPSSIYPEVAPFDLLTPKHPTLEPNMKWMGNPLQRYEMFQSEMSIVCRQYTVHTYTDVISSSLR